MGTPFGKPAKIAANNGPEYKAMAESVLEKLREHMTEIEFKAWQYREFEARGGGKMEEWDARMVWMKALNELSHPTECECGGLPDREITCRLCQSIAHVSREAAAIERVVQKASEKGTLDNIIEKAQPDYNNSLLAERIG